MTNTLILVMTYVLLFIDIKKSYFETNDCTDLKTRLDITKNKLKYIKSVHYVRFFIHSIHQLIHFT